MLSFCIGLFVMDDLRTEVNFRDAQKKCRVVAASCPCTSPMSMAASWVFPPMRIVTRHLGWLSGIPVDPSALPPPQPAAPAFRGLGRQIPKHAETVSRKPLNTPRRHMCDSFRTVTQ